MNLLLDDVDDPLMVVFCFDRDLTVDVNPSDNPPEYPVPLDWVKYLAHETLHPTWATGNQHLCKEADIPGANRAREWYMQMEGREPEYRNTNYQSPNYNPQRRDKLRLIKDCYEHPNCNAPDPDAYVVVDDVLLTDMEDEGWTYFSPWGFVDRFEPFFEGKELTAQYGIVSNHVGEIPPVDREAHMRNEPNTYES